MKWYSVTAVCSVFWASGLWAQKVSDSEIVARITSYRQHFDDASYGRSLREESLSRGKDVAIRLNVAENHALCDHCPTTDSTDDPEVKRAALTSDLVVLGTVTKNISALTRNDKSIFTDSEFVIDEVWKNQHANSLQTLVEVGDEISIMRLGGTVGVNGHTLRVSLSNQLPLQIGHRYLMFLRYQPEVGAYVPIWADGYDVTLSNVVPLHSFIAAADRPLLGDKRLFLDSMRSSTRRGLMGVTK